MRACGRKRYIYALRTREASSCARSVVRPIVLPPPPQLTPHTQVPDMVLCTPTTDVRAYCCACRCGCAPHRRQTRSAGEGKHRMETKTQSPAVRAVHASAASESCAPQMYSSYGKQQGSPVLCSQTRGRLGRTRALSTLRTVVATMIEGSRRIAASSGPFESIAAV